MAKRIIVLVIVGIMMFTSCVYGAEVENMTVEEKVAQVVSSVITSSMSERDKALALHDWLTNNAFYDKTLTYHSPDGVLLHGTGVCESYAEAYRLLLEKAGIDCRTITGTAQKFGGEQESHAWNLVKIDGIWSHVDVTWDDPIGEVDIPKSGEERQLFFMVSTSFIRLDHFPDEKSEALMKELIVDEDMVTLPDPVDVSSRIEVPDFSFKKSDGKVLTKDNFGKDKRLIMVYGRTTCFNTLDFLENIAPFRNLLKENNITILLALFDDPSTKEMAEMEELCPGIICTKVTEDDDSIWEGLSRFNARTDEVSLPVIFLKNKNNAMTSYSTGFVYEPAKLVAGAIVMGDEAAPPIPESEIADGEKSDEDMIDPSSANEESKENASMATVGNGKYKLNKKKKTANFYAPVKKTVKKITVPATVKVSGKTYKVTAVSANAFKGCKKLTSVTIGKNVTSIGKKAFYKCSKLKTVIIKTTKLKKVGTNAFKGINSKAKIRVPKKKIKSYKKLLKIKRLYSL